MIYVVLIKFIIHVTFKLTLYLIFTVLYFISQ